MSKTAWCSALLVLLAILVIRLIVTWPYRRPAPRPVAAVDTLVASTALELNADMRHKTGDRYRVFVPVRESLGTYETLTVIINKTTRREKMPEKGE
jgi:hypothetical protein